MNLRKPLLAMMMTPALNAVVWGGFWKSADRIPDVMIADSWDAIQGSDWAATYLNLKDRDQDDIARLAQSGEVRLELLVSGVAGTRFKVQILPQGQDENSTTGFSPSVYEVHQDRMDRIVIDLPKSESPGLIRRIVIHSGATVFGEDLGNRGMNRPVGVLYVRFFQGKK